MYYIIEPTNSDLYHHGIFGQKWGKQNGPPYPLDGPDHSSSEKKAGWTKSLKKYQREDGTLTRKGKRTFKKYIALDEKRKEALKEAQIQNQKEYKYLKKSGYLKGNGENYKEALRDLSFVDKDFNKLVKNRVDSETKLSKISEEQTKELMRIASKRCGPLTVIGYDRTNRIIRNMKGGK